MELLIHEGKQAVEFSVVRVSELEFENRFDAEYYAPEYLRNEAVLDKFERITLDSLMKNCDYGLSIAMNEDKIGFKILKMDDIIGLLANDLNCKYVDIGVEEFNKNKLEYGDVLFNRVNSEGFVGRTGIYLLKGKHTFASYLIRIRTKNEATNFFLTVFLNTKYGKAMLRRISRRAVNQANINASELKSLRIPYLSNAFQEEIRGLILAADEKRNQAASLIQKAEKILSIELGLDEKGCNPQVGYIVNKSEITRNNRFDAEYYQPVYRSLLDAATQKTPLKKLGEIVTFDKGVEVGSEEYKNDGVLFVRVSNLSKYELTGSDQKYISENLYGSLRSKYQPKKGDVLLSKDATPGVAFFVNEETKMIISSGILRLTVISEIDKNYLTFVLNSFFVQSQIERDAGGSIIVHWRPEQIRETLIPVLPSSKQKEIAQFVEESHHLRVKAKELIQTAVKKLENAISAPT